MHAYIYALGVQYISIYLRAQKLICIHSMYTNIVLLVLSYTNSFFIGMYACTHIHPIKINKHFIMHTYELRHACTFTCMHILLFVDQDAQ